MSQIKLLVALALLVVLTILIIGGQAPVQVLNYNVPLILVVITSVFIGAFLAAFLGIAEIFSLKKVIKKKKKENSEVKDKITSLQLKIRELEEKTEADEQPEDDKMSGDIG